jgi:tetratricopeptide (TPR) repeat protein
MLAATRLGLGDVAGYREACRSLAVPTPRAVYEESPYLTYDDFNLGRIATCCLGPNAVDDPSALVKQAEDFAAQNALHAPYLDLALLGTAHYRAGNYQEAAQCLEQSIAQYPNDPPPSHGTVHGSQLFLAMTKWQQGKHDDARRLLNEIQPALDKSLKAPTLLWQSPMTGEMLRREAEALIESKEADDAVEKK